MPTKPTKAQISAAKAMTSQDGHAIIENMINMDDPSVEGLANDMVRAGVAERVAVVGSRRITPSGDVEQYTYSLTNDIHKLGDFVMSYDPQHNDFLTALINRIAFVVVRAMTYDRKLEWAKKGYVEFGEVIEEVFAEISRPHVFSPSKAEKEVFKREIPNVYSAFHRMNVRIFYKQTISNDQLRTAFLSWQGITDLVAKIIRNMVTAMNVDEDLLTKYMIARCILNGYMYPMVTQPLTVGGADASAANLIDIQAMAGNLEWPSNKYNMAGVYNATPLERQRVIMTNRALAIYGVQNLANAFNLSLAEWQQTTFTVDSFSNLDWERLTDIFTDPDTGVVDPDFQPFTDAEVAILESITGVIVDIDWFMIFDNFNNMTQNYNGEGLYWNYWLHGWKTFSASPFANAIVLTSTKPTITAVTVSPTAVTVSPGQRVTLEATVTGTGVVSKNVRWTVAGDAPLASGTHIENGTLYVAVDETNATLTVTATSAADAAKSAEATVTVQKA